MKEKLINYGGQALIEGVLMRGKRSCAFAVRVPGGEIVVKKEKLTGIYKQKIFNLPFLRGLIMLWDSLGLGMRALTESANMQSGEGEKIEGATLFFTVALSLVAGVGIFFIIPAAMGWLTERFLSWNPWWSNFFEGILRLIMLVGYIWIIGYIPDIKRVFAYHGAEHKTINAFEAGEKMTPQNIMKFPIAHPRCGTAFLLTLMVLSLFIFTILGPLPLGWRIASRILTIPFLVGIAYEYLKWTSQHLDNSFIRLLVVPNLALQSLTTREPDISMVEVSLAAFNSMLEGENE
jgi:uncharacterized protein YqhQ